VNGGRTFVEGRAAARPVSIPIDDGAGRLEADVSRMFALVSESLAGATDALLAGEPSVASRVVAGDEVIDELSGRLSERIWEDFDRLVPASQELRRLVGLLLIVPELERSADLAEHIAQRAVTGLGLDMSAISRGIVQRMSDVALEMWHQAAESYALRTAAGTLLDEADEELDILRDRLTKEVASAAMPPSVAAQVTLIGRFYERLGDHAVNLARRIEVLPEEDRRRGH
jgi:phosphate transport system protein